jgi:hypothetical protein
VRERGGEELEIDWGMEDGEGGSTLAASSTGSSPRHPVPAQAKVRP